MPTVLNRTTKQLKYSASEAEHPIQDWIYNPNLSAVQGFDSKYWIIDGDSVLLMSEAQRQAVDAEIKDSEQQSIINSIEQPLDVLKYIILFLLDKINYFHSHTSVIVGTGNIDYDPPSISNGASVTSSAITVNGAQFGDIVEVLPPYDLQGVLAFGYVSSVNTVIIRLINNTGSSKNLPSGQWKVVVRRYVNQSVSYNDFKTILLNYVKNDG